MELTVHIVVAGREVGGQRRIDADGLANVGAVEEGPNLPSRFEEKSGNLRGRKEVCDHLVTG